jgi:hypothetical protein
VTRFKIDWDDNNQNGENIPPTINTDSNQMFGQYSDKDAMCSIQKNNVDIMAAAMDTNSVSMEVDVR